MKKMLLVALLITALILMSACGYYNVIDTTYAFDYAYVELPTGEVVEGKVENWRDYSDGDQFQVRINGTTYLSNSTRIVLVAK